ncbi:MAG: acyl--CoA ligase [Alphaproteobacteria bacterium]|nr:acyl--CoA ligase [Alphaproteobacteria bacterium]
MSNLSLFDTGPAPACPTPFNMAAYIMAAGLANPDKIAIEILSQHGVETWSYDELWSAVRATAGALQAMGLPPQSRIMLRLGNDIRFPILFLAAIWAGLVPVPTSSELTEPEVAAMIAEVQPSLICVGDGVAPPKAPPCPMMLAPQIKSAAEHSFGKVVMGDPSQMAYIVYTSGNSGRPHAVCHAHRAIWARRMMWQDWMGLTPQDRLLHAGAFNWTYTLGTGLCDPWAIGATSLVAAPDLDRAALAQAIKTRDVSIFAAVPGVYRQILKLKMPLEFPRLRHCLSAGEKLGGKIRQEWEARSNRLIHEAFGMTELSTFISASPEHPATGAHLGRPQSGRSIAVLDPETRHPVPFGKPGTLAVSKSDPGLMLGYLGQKPVGKSRPDDRWFLTGDTVSMEASGWITYLGRNHDMMNAGGYRVSPIEVETVLNTHPDIIQSACAAVEIKADTFVIAAFYQSGIELAPDELARFCSGRLARYKCPRVFRRLDSLPTGTNGKLRRRELARLFKDMT